MRYRFEFSLAMLTVLFAVGAWFLPSCSGDSRDETARRQTTGDVSHTAHWDYGLDNGPVHWGELNPEWVLCAEGTQQSPIDIVRTESEPLDPLTMDFPSADVEIRHQAHVLDAIDNGHTIQINYDGGETFVIGETRYELVQFHFHSPSEHTVNGTHYPMEMHLVHKTAGNELAVIGVFIEEGTHNGQFEKIWARLPRQKGETVHIEDFALDIDDMVPRNHSSYRYHGSLTTPPCSEGVRWFLLVEPIAFSSDQIDAFRQIFAGNNRPVQPLNNRRVKIDSRG